MLRIIRRVLFGASVVAAFPFCLTAQRRCGAVVDESGAGVKDTLVVASGVGFDGWATTATDGSFCVARAGAFVSARHAGFTPVLTTTPPEGTLIRIQLIKPDGAEKTLPSCRSLPGEGRAWIGSGLRVRPPFGRYKGPVYGEHDSHWYINRGEQTLHIVNGYAWHAGLPSQILLVKSQSIHVRGWEFEGIVGLDLSGQLGNGRRWRWFGAPVAEAIEYENALPDEAEYFDRVLESVCFGL